MNTSDTSGHEQSPTLLIEAYDFASIARQISNVVRLALHPNEQIDSPWRPHQHLSFE